MSSRTVVHELDFERAWAVCRRYEDLNGMDSEEFVERYQRGKVDPTPLAMRWMATYEALLRLAPSESDLEDADLLIST